MLILHIGNTRRTKENHITKQNQIIIKKSLYITFAQPLKGAWRQNIVRPTLRLVIFQLLKKWFADRNKQGKHAERSYNKVEDKRVQYKRVPEKSRLVQNGAKQLKIRIMDHILIRINYHNQIMNGIGFYIKF